MEYKIGRKGKEQSFKLDFVSNYCHLKYGELVDLSFTLSDTIEEARKEALLDIRKPFARTEYVKKNRELETKIKSLREEILRELLETNDYTYDAGWWMHNATPAEVNAIVTETVRGEIENTKAIKKK